MTIGEAISRIDELVPNTYPAEQKIKWLSRMDMDIFESLIRTHEDGIEEFNGYDGEVDMETELLAPKPFAHIYDHYLESQIHYYNGDYSKFNNANGVLADDYRDMRNWYNREHMPKGIRFTYF